MELIPKQLRRAHEDGQVVFFCGAGVSIPAGLPSYWNLVRNVLSDLLPTEGRCQPGSTEALAWEALRHDRYDEALEILESPQEGGHEPRNVRERVRHHLLPKKTKSLAKHLILCRLADLDSPQGRLVTTNFDHLFEKAQQKLTRTEGTRHRLTTRIAPVLPPAKPQASTGLTYLHGKLDHSANNSDLVLTMSDFGVAYLLEGWARRFVVELFRHYHVVFIGYRVEDPTMRYLVSALAAAQAQFKHFKKAYAFAPFNVDAAGVSDKTLREQEWKLKRLSPIAYNDSNDHEQLWSELAEWADDHRQGLAGRRQTVARLGRFPPLDRTDSATREMAWALSDPMVAKHFANLLGDERPDSRWIAPLQEAGLLDQPLGETNDSHPISTSLASRVVSDGLGLNPATFELGRWIARCLDSSDVLNWALSQGGVLHHQLRSQIQWQLKNDAAEIPPALVKFWRVLSDNAYAHDLSSKRQRSWDYPRLEPGSVSSRRTFLGRLRPIPVFSHRIHFPDEDHVAEPDNPTDWYRVEIELVGIEGDHDIRRFRERATDWSGALVVMAHDITTHLAGALEWLEEFGRASPSDDWTHLEYRSVSPHDQNEHAPTWTNLIALARDSYDALVESGDETAALRLARRWQSLPYPVFRRLTLYAATGGQDA